MLEQVEITGVAAEGKALARVNDLVVFVPFAAPGDIVDLQLIRKISRLFFFAGKSFLRAFRCLRRV